MLKHALVVALAVVAAWTLIAPRHGRAALPPRAALASFPLRIDTWASTGKESIDSRTLSALGTDDYLDRVYEQPGEPPIGVYVGYYEHQRQSATAHSPLHCLPGAGWAIERHDTVRIGASGSHVVNRIHIRNDVTKLVMLYWYQSHDRVLASEYWSKVYLVLDAVRLRRTDGALVRVTTPVTEWEPYAERAAEGRVLRFVERMFPLLGAYVPA